MPKISVIVPIYRVEAYLHRCVDSILNQSFGDFNLILVDDGSPDNCGTICDGYAKQDNRVHVIHKANGGLSDARNAGIDWVFENSDSQWLAFIDSDDWVHRDYLKILYSAASRHGAKIAACDMIRTGQYVMDADLKTVQEYCMDSEEAYVTDYGVCMCACTKLFRKSLFENIRFPVGKLHEDAYITHILLFHAGKIVVCDAPLYYYYFNPESITRARWSPKRLDEIDAHEQRLLFFQRNGYASAYKRELEAYADVLLEQAELLMDFQKEDRSCKPFLKQIRKKLRNVLRQESQTGRLTFDQGRHWIYLMAFSAGVFYGMAKSLQKAKNARRTE